MNTVQIIAKNTIALVISSIANMVMGFFFTMYVARYVGVDGFGILSFAIAVTSIFSVLTHLGLNQLTIREVARDRALAGKYLANITTFKIILSVLTFTAIALYATFMGYQQQTIMVVYIITLATIADGFSQSFFSIFQAYERMEFVTLAGVLSTVLRLAGALFVISHGFDLIAIAFAYFVSSVATLSWSYAISTWKFTRLPLQLDFSFLKGALAKSWPLGLITALSALSTWIGTVILKGVKGDEAVGYYNAAYRIESFLLFISVAYSSAIFPAMSRLYVSSIHSLKAAFEKSVKYLMIFGVPLGIGTALLANKLIILIYGAQFANSAGVLRILMLPLVFDFVGPIFGQLFVSLNKQITVLKVTIISTALNITLNLLLIPRYSYIGASIAVATTQFVALNIMYVLSFRMGYGFSGKKVIDIAKALPAGVIMGIFAIFLFKLPLWYLIPISAVVYFVVLFMIRAIDKDDIQMLRSTIQKREISPNANAVQ